MFSKARAAAGERRRGRKKELHMTWRSESSILERNVNYTGSGAGFGLV
jgi:hypothetical protein